MHHYTPTKKTKNKNTYKLATPSIDNAEELKIVLQKTFQMCIAVSNKIKCPPT